MVPAPLAKLVLSVNVSDMRTPKLNKKNKKKKQKQKNKKNNTNKLFRTFIYPFCNAAARAIQLVKSGESVFDHRLVEDTSLYRISGIINERK